MIAAAMLIATQQARAGFDLGAAANFSVLGYGTSASNEFGDAVTGPASIIGNIGVGQDAKLTIGGSGSVVTQQVLYYDPITSTNFIVSPAGTLSINGSTCTSLATCTANGSIARNQTLLGSADTAMANLYNSVSQLTATAGSVTQVTGSQTISVASNTTYVANISSLNLGNNMTLTLQGDSTDYFVFNITGNFNGNGTGKITLNGVADDHVIFNLLTPANGGKTGSTAQLANSFIGAGIILGLASDITDNGQTVWNGRLFGAGNSDFVKVKGGATVGAPEIDASSGTAAIAFVLGVLALVGERRKARTRVPT